MPWIYYSKFTGTKHKSVYEGYFTIYVPSIHIIFTIIPMHGLAPVYYK